MSSAQKIIQAAAGNAAGEGLAVEDVFSTYLYDGTGAAQTITNGIDLDGEGGLVWIKSRLGAYNHWLFDTERGAGASLKTNDTDAENPTLPNSLSSFNSDGFSVVSLNGINNSGEDLASWTFRKAPKFFDVVTYTGTGSARTVSHNLGSVPGTIIVKVTDNAGGWQVYHRSTGATKYLVLNETQAAGTSSNQWNNTAPTDSVFTVGNIDTNESGRNYVAYLFAHNDGDGNFGPTEDQDIIKCGTYTGSGTTNQEINLGFEPQWLLVKNIDGATGTLDWTLFDNMREWANRTSGDNVALYPNTSGAESGIARCFPTAQGFAFHNDQAYSLNFSGDNYIYIAIRRGPMKTPESGTEVFAADNQTRTSDGSSPRHRADFPVDMAFYKGQSGGDSYISDRLRQTFLTANSTSSEFSSVAFDFQNGWIDSSTVVSNNVSWMFRRAPGFFDVVAYEGTGSAHSEAHNLGVAPEMMIIKPRNSSYQWSVWHKDIASTSPYYEIVLNSTNAQTDANNTNSPFSGVPTSTGFPLPSGTASASNRSGYNYIAYLFATLPGVSKVGSYTGNGTSQTIDCGFSTGARFVLIKRTDSTGDWHVYDSERGIVAGNDPRLELNTTDAEDTGSDDIDPVSSGFSVTSNADVNTNSAEYIFLAIA